MSEESIEAVLMSIPHELDIEGRPELRKFPANALFAKIGVREGMPVVGLAMYEPDLSSLERSGSHCSLTYRNEYGGDFWLRITYDTDRDVWEGEKRVNGNIVGSAAGSEWNGFFTHLTLLGLANGERCAMESPPEGPS